MDDGEDHWERIRDRELSLKEKCPQKESAGRGMPDALSRSFRPYCCGCAGVLAGVTCSIGRRSYVRNIRRLRDLSSLGVGDQDSA